MNLGVLSRRLSFFLAALSLGFGAQAAHAQQELPSEQPDVVAQAEGAQPSADQSLEDISAGGEAAPGADAPAFEYFGPEMIKGQPTNGAIGFQEQHSPNGEYALWMHNAILMPVIVIISLFVLGLLIWVAARYNRRANKVPSKTSHNTLIEVVWTLVPVLVLVAIAIPSITLLARQYDSPPKDALTVKVTGYQWYWGYTYPDNGGFEVISNMMDEGEALEKGLPPQLAVDNRMVLPVGEEIRIQTTGADVIHSFAIPSLWFKLDAVPGRLNEKKLFIEEEGIYYGQCSELCGARHGFMPIAIEAVSRERFNQWILSQGGELAGQTESEPAAIADPEVPESAAPGAEGALFEEPEPETPTP
jgi:cytochrome c oxidase subunit 2